jgi:hypothetical protein
MSAVDSAFAVAIARKPSGPVSVADGRVVPHIYVAGWAEVADWVSARSSSNI